MEFIAILLLCWRRGIRNVHHNLHGDSMSLLAWAQADRVNSTLAHRRNIVFSTVSMHWDATVSVTICDGLSRNISTFDLGLVQSKEHDGNNDSSLLTILRLYDPDDP